ncbi:MAG: hypothetical protein KY391_01675 [Actinobacteria bacterium]|nr:hypothetical protein [Actinomycetota bacterium]
MLLLSCEATAPDEDRLPPDRTEISSGGTVTFGVLGEPPTLDPYARDATDLTYFLARPVFRSLYRVGPGGVAEADLAAGLTADGRGAVIDLRRATWSDGARITATDVVRSVARARYPSGFAGLDADVVDRDTVRITGDVDGEWDRRLAVGTFVLPRRSGLRVGSGPFVATRYVPGLEIVYEPNPRWPGEAAVLDRVVVQFVSTTQIMLELLEDARLDAGAVPSTVNLDERLGELGIAHAETRGWEKIVLDLDGTADRLLRATIVNSIDREHIARGLVRDEGTPVEAPLPDEHVNDPNAEILLGTASGDELLQLIQRVMQKQLAQNDIKAELVQIDPATLYGEWESDSPLDVSLRREIVPEIDGRVRAEQFRWFPLFSVDTFLAWTDGVRGLEPNGTLDGPLWNAHEWWLE